MSFDPFAASFALLESWPISNVAAAYIDPSGAVHTHGLVDEKFRLASVTKIVSTYAILIALEEGTVALDDSVGPPDCTVGDVPDCTLRHVLSHASGLPLNGLVPIARPAQRRIYSNTGINLAAEHVAKSAEMPFAQYLHEAVFEPLQMTSTELVRAPAWGGVSTANDLVRFASELLGPTLISRQTLTEAISAQWPELNGVLPGLGPQRPNPWGLGFEIRGHKSPHWTGRLNSPETFGHFGQSGTFLWSTRLPTQHAWRSLAPISVYGLGSFGRRFLIPFFRRHPANYPDEARVYARAQVVLERCQSQVEWGALLRR